MTLTQLTFDLWHISRDHVWPESRFGVCQLTLSAVSSLFVVLNVQICEMMLVPCIMLGVKVTWRSSQGHWPFDDLGSLFRVLLVSRVVFGADFDFSSHLNIYAVVLVPSFHVTKLSVVGDTYYGWPTGRLLVDLTWPDPTWPKCIKTSSVIKTNMKFVISTPKYPVTP